ncbi:MAG: PHP domain-containing protein [Gammaproteobacteria bacterium]|nr:PHP domain-containing protein [Gammaproteobacteria bacterium]
MIASLPAVAADNLFSTVDLHCHSTASDGILRPAELVSRAKLRGVTLLALTDHDTVAGLAEAQCAAEAENLAVLPGIELTASRGRRIVHIVGLNIDIESTALQGAIALREKLRIERALMIAERLEKRGFVGALAGARAEAGDAVLGRPHFARWMVAQGLVKNAAQAFKRYLGAGKLGDVAVAWPDMAASIATIEAAGGQAVLAHPLKYGLSRTQLLGLLNEFQQAGGRGVELVCGQQKPEQTRELNALLQRQAAIGQPLLCSVGSDFHQPGQSWRELGSARLPEGAEPIWTLWQTGVGTAIGT